MTTSSTDFQLVKKLIATTQCEEVAEIMLPQLKKHGITVFNYYYMYFDGSVIRFSTDRAWTEHFYKKDYLNKLTLPRSYLLKPLNYFIWLREDCPEILLDAAINFNTSNGISIALNQPDGIEYFCFATTSDNTAIVNNFYLNNLDLLQKYCSYFKNKGAFLLQKQAKEKLIKLPATHKINELQNPSNNGRLPSLSNRQFACASLLLKGLTLKEIALELNISPRTVETHLNLLKTKLACRNKAELLIKFSSLNL